MLELVSIGNKTTWRNANQKEAPEDSFDLMLG